MDTEWLARIGNAMHWSDNDAERRAWFEFKLRYRFIRDRVHFWDVDHIVSVVEGGGSCGLEGLRTVCAWCHVEETAKLRKRLAKGGTDA
jgi:hypothetical protein